MAVLAAAPNAADVRAPSNASWTRRSPARPAAAAVRSRAATNHNWAPMELVGSRQRIGADRHLTKDRLGGACPGPVEPAHALGYFQFRAAPLQGDSKVIEYLNKGLRSELTAVNQYWIHYRMLENWGYRDLAKKWRKESIEEMQHADKFTVRIIFLEGFPNMQVIDPLHIGQNVKEVLESDLQSEYSARSLYQEAATYCHSVQDYVSRDLFEELMADEEDHIDFLETQLDLVAKLGLELYSQHHIGELDDEE